MGLWREAADLVWPQRCAGCGQVGRVLCGQCQLELLGPVRRREAGAPRLVMANAGPSLPVWASAWYDGPVQRVLVAWKRHGVANLDRELERAIRRTAQAIRPALAQALDHFGSLTVSVVPIPSRRVSRLKRTGADTAYLAGAVAAAIHGPVHWVASAPAEDRLLNAGRVSSLTAYRQDLLQRKWWAGEQQGRSTRARQVGRQGTTTVLGQPMGPVLLVDDVLTTGATLLDAERALSRAGGVVLGAVVLAVARPISGPLGSWPT